MHWKHHSLYSFRLEFCPSSIYQSIHIINIYIYILYEYILYIEYILYYIYINIYYIYILYIYILYIYIYICNICNIFIYIYYMSRLIDWWRKGLLKSHFVMVVLLQICSIFSEHLFVGTPLDGCFCVFSVRCLLSMSYLSICGNCCIYYIMHGFCFISKIIWYTSI